MCIILHFRAVDLFAQEGLDRHNTVPEREGNPYSLDQDLCRGAQAYADELARTKIFQHADLSGSNIGENLAWNSNIKWSDGRTEPGLKPSAASVVERW